MTAFEELGVMPEIVRAVEEMDWLLPTDIQHEAIPLILGGGDVLMAAETGSGKTGAFSLPVLQIVAESLREASTSHSSASSSSLSGPPTLNSNDRDSMMAIDPSGVLCQSRDERGWHGCRATIGVTSGKAYFEAVVTDEGLCRVGWATLNALRNLGTDKLGFGFGGTGKKSFSKQFDEYGRAFGKGDVIGCYLDRDNGTIGWSINGEYCGDAFEIPSHLAKTPLFPAVVLKNAEMRFEFGASPFKFPPTHGHKGLAQMKRSQICGYQDAKPQVKSGRSPYALILEPSRELAEQTFNQIVKFKKHLPFPGVKEALLIGGVNARDQLQLLQTGVDIVIGTPGRVEDFVSKGKLDLSQVRFYILDEVDGLLRQGHKECVSSLYQKMPKETNGERLQMIVCSATLHAQEVKTFAETMMFHPIWVDLKGMDAVPDTVHHTIVHIDPDKDSWWKTNKSLKTDGMHASHGNLNGQEEKSLATKLLKFKYLQNAIETYNMDQAIIFCRTKLDCDNVELFLNSLGGGSSMINEYSCACMHSDRPMPVRRKNLQGFKEGEIRFLICTDVAARGIDVKGVPYVINVTLPDEKENYVHRIGRVGRADRMGLAISLVSTVEEKVWYHTCPSRGKGCRNTRLKSHGGCAIWYNEPKLLQEIQEHLGTVIPVTDATMQIPTEHTQDGHVIYGEKRGKKGSSYEGHAELLAPAVRSLGGLEHKAQSSFLSLMSYNN